MLLIAHMYDAIVGAKAVGMNARLKSHFAANNSLNAGLFAVWHNLGVNPAIAFIDAEDNRLASCSASTLASHAPRAKVRFIQLDIAGERRLSLAMLRDGLTNQFQITVDSIAIQTAHGSDLSGSQIKGQESQQLPKFSTRNSCAFELLGTNCHDLVYSHFSSSYLVMTQVLYNERSNKTIIQTSLLQVQGDWRNGTSLRAGFDVTGKDIAKPSTLTLTFFSAASDRTYADNRALKIFLDGKEVLSSVAHYVSGNTNGEIYLITVTQEVPYEMFLQLINSKSVKMQVGPTAFELRGSDLEALKDLKKMIE